jgi:hypothetical protein
MTAESETQPGAAQLARLDGLVAIAGLFYLAGLLVRGQFVNTADGAAFARWSGSPTFSWAWVLLAMGSITEVISFWPLYLRVTRTRASRLGFFGALLSFLDRAVWAGLQILMAFAPAVFGGFLADLMNAPAPFLALFALSQLGILGNVGLAVALWRSRMAPPWVAVLYALHLPLLATAMISYPVELLGPLVLLVSGGWFALHGRR